MFLVYAPPFASALGHGGPPVARGRLTQLVANWLRQREPELLASDRTSWELVAPRAFVDLARSVLAGNGQVFDHYTPTRGAPLR